MKKTFCISKKNLPTKLPTLSTVVLLIALDHWNAPDLVRGISYAIFGLLWGACISSWATQKEVDPFEFKDEDPLGTEKAAKSKFQQKLDEMAKERGYKTEK